LFSLFAVLSTFALFSGLSQAVKPKGEGSVAFFISNAVIFCLCSYVSMKCFRSFLVLSGLFNE